MKVLLSKVKEALGKVAPALGGENVTMTVLEGTSNLVLSAVNGSFAIFATIRDVVDATPLNVELNANFLKSRFMTMPNRMLEIVKRNGMMSFSLEKEDDDMFFYSFNAPFMDMGNVKTLDDKSSEKYATEIEVKGLGTYISDTSHALEKAFSASDTRRTSYYVEIDKNNKIRVTTTDSHRISVRQGAIGDVAYKFLIPGVEMKTAVSLLDKNVKLRVPKKGEYLQLVGTDIVIVMPIVALSFFDTKRIIDHIEETAMLNLVVDKNVLVNICRFVTDGDPKLIFETKGDLLNITNNCTMGTMNANLKVEKTPDTKDIKLGFSSKFLMEALESIRSERVDITISSDNGVTRIMPHLEDGQKPKSGKAIEVVLPMRI